MKKCTRCKIIKLKNEFSFRSEKKKGHLLRSQCKSCVSELSRKRRNKLKKINPIGYKERSNKLAREWRKNNPSYMENGYGFGKFRYIRSKVAAKRHGCVWSLNREEYYKLISQPCYYCGSGVNRKGIGLDKKDSNIKCYKMENVVPCCSRCNWVKGNWFTFEQMIEIGVVIKRFNRSKQFNFNYFENRECSFYPCHKLEHINCLFCFCPLFHIECIDGRKDCMDCTFPHQEENYKKVIDMIVK